MNHMNHYEGMANQASFGSAAAIGRRYFAGTR